MVDVVFVAGAGRSGSTLAARLLGQISGWNALGEIRYVWERGLLRNHRCECGAAFHECPFWTGVLERQHLNSDRTDIASLVREGERLLRTRRAHRALRHVQHPERWLAGSVSYARRVDQLYSALAAAVDDGVIVDSSKLPSYAQVLRACPNVRLSVLHLVRDPRATANSWRRPKVEHGFRDGSEMAVHSALHSAAVWAANNLLAEALLDRDGRYVRVRYEDLAAEPQQSLQRAVDALGFACRVPDFDAPGQSFRRGHALAGNPDLHVATSPTVRLDDAWRTELPPRDRRVVTTLTRPLLRRYGFAEELPIGGAA